MTFRRRRWVLLAALIAIIVVAACTDRPEPRSAAPADPFLTNELASMAREMLLSPKDLPNLAGRSASLTMEDMADETGDSEVITELESSGYLGGFMRDLRGRAPDVTGANSRVLVFSDPEGAQSFATWVAENADPFFGAPGTVRAMTVGQHNGYLITPPFCDCPGAFPVYVGLIDDGNFLHWLQVTGPRVTVGELRQLLAGQASAGA